ncbi:uncharacterized protein LOC131323571 [Rhododendron vialii]|uniref:uncharacterized protein LOC131323571 n=1 Tax=Rhododendron vialii TaxID=182163 RepID=UPI00265DCCF0|nr:uncharacterized protein LOC131323571 [Rhododendron vialii]
MGAIKKDKIKVEIKPFIDMTSVPYLSKLETIQYSVSSLFSLNAPPTATPKLPHHHRRTPSRSALFSLLHLTVSHTVISSHPRRRATPNPPLLPPTHHHDLFFFTGLKLVINAWVHLWKPMVEQMYKEETGDTGWTLILHLKANLK